MTHAERSDTPGPCTPRMRIAVLNDIHGNLPALEAVLKETRRESVDRIVVGGDVFPGPMPHLVLDALLSADVPVDFIYGNGEVAVLEPSLAPEPYRPLIAWNAEQLDDAKRQLVRQWPMTLRLGDILFCHATPRDVNEIFTANTAEERLLPVFEPANAAVVVCGHTHMQFDRMVGKTRVINAGSVGMPFGRTGADWLLIDSLCELRHTGYDLEAAAQRIRESRSPGAGEFATTNVLNSPSAAAILEAYSKHELRA